MNSTEKTRTSKVRNSKTLNPEQYIGKDVFKFANDDAYVGQFKATIKEEIYRDGFGKYFCDDGSMYEGTWNADYLEEASSLTFVNNDVYKGALNNFKFHGKGVYQMSQVGDIESVFDCNHPIGDTVCTDPCGFNWKGVAKKESSEILLYPVNHFKLTTDEESEIPDENVIENN